MVPPDVPEYFIPRRARSRAGESLLYRPALLGVARLHYAEKKAGIDYWETLVLVRSMDGAVPAEPWDGSEPFDDGVPELEKTPEAGGRFGSLPAELARAKSYAAWTKELKSFLYRERTLRVWNCAALKEWSRPLESEREFRLRLVQASREERDQRVEALRAKYAPKLDSIEDQIRRARRSLSANSRRRVGRTGMRGLRSAARYSEQFSGARRSARPTSDVQPQQPRRRIVPRNSAMMFLRPPRRSIP